MVASAAKTETLARHIRPSLLSKHGAIRPSVCSEREPGRRADGRDPDHAGGAVCSWFGLKPPEPDLHSQVPEQTRRDLSGLKTSQNRRPGEDEEELASI